MAKQAIGLKIPFRLGNDGYFETNKDTISQVSSNIRNLLLTKPGERRFNNSFGSGLHKLLFEQNTLDDFRQIIIDVVQNDLNRFVQGAVIKDVKVQLSNDPNFLGSVNNDLNKVYISVIFTYKNVTSETQVTLQTNNI